MQLGMKCDGTSAALAEKTLHDEIDDRKRRWRRQKNVTIIDTWHAQWTFLI